MKLETGFANTEMRLVSAKNNWRNRLGLKIAKDELSDIEWKIIYAYREKTDMQKAVNILLGIDTE